MLKDKQITLTEDEARVLYQILGCVGGNPVAGKPRYHADTAREKINSTFKIAFPYSKEYRKEHWICSTHQSIYFECEVPGKCSGCALNRSNKDVPQVQYRNYQVW